MARRPGPAPKSPETRVRRNADPVVGADGWTDIEAGAFQGEVPQIPDWVSCGEAARAFYLELAKLPQAATWGPGDWLTLHASLPLLDRYFSRPGSESYKAWTSVLDPGLRITSDAMQKARVRVRAAQAEESSEARTPAGVSDLSARRSRLTKGA